MPADCLDSVHFLCARIFIINILNSCPTQGRVEGWDSMKPLYYRSVSSKGAGRPRLTHHHKGRWNETKWMRWVRRNGGMKFVVGENGRNPMKNLPRPHFVHHETHMEGPRRELGTPAVGGERLTACATRPPCLYKLYITFCCVLLFLYTFKQLWKVYYDNITVTAWKLHFEIFHLG